MPRCRSVTENLTAWVDGELSGRRQARIDNHLARCHTCSREAESLRRAIDRQRQLLGQLRIAEPVDSQALWWAIERARRQDEARDDGWSIAWLRPAIFAAALVATLVAFVSAAGGPQAVLIPLGVKPPPAVVRRAPEMFKDYEMIQQLEILENFDTVDAVPLEEDESSEQG